MLKSTIEYKFTRRSITITGKTINNVWITITLILVRKLPCKISTCMSILIFKACSAFIKGWDERPIIVSGYNLSVMIITADLLVYNMIPFVTITLILVRKLPCKISGSEDTFPIITEHTSTSMTNKIHNLLTNNSPRSNGFIL
jgi:hypothetical protein